MSIVRTFRTLAMMVVGLTALLVLSNAPFPAATPASALPTNDSFGNALVFSNLPFTDARNTVGATTQAGEPLTCGSAPIASTVWYSFTPAATMDLAAHTFGSDYDTVVAVYTGNSVGSLTPVDCNDDSFSLQSLVTFSASAGTTYRFQVGGFGGEVGDLVFNLEQTGLISGTVTEEGSGDPLPDICVIAQDVAIGGDYTDALGQYSIVVPQGTYSVEFRDCLSSPTVYVSEWYNNKPDFASADPVSVTAGSTTSGINAVLAVGGSILGTVTEEGTGTALPDICVSAWDASWNWLGWGYTDASGD